LEPPESDLTQAEINAERDEHRAKILRDMTTDEIIDILLDMPRLRGLVCDVMDDVAASRKPDEAEIGRRFHRLVERVGDAYYRANSWRT